jgi:thioredoxin-dependent peroxiredoxin
MRLFAPFAAAAMIAAALPASAALAPGARAPDFTTQGAIAGKAFRVKLSEQLKRGPVVLYFFPAAFTSGCNAEAKAFADAVPQFRAAGATVIGMSADNVEQLQKFSTEHCAGKFAVASATPELLRQYDVLLDRPNLPRAMSDRTSYVIAPNGRIAFAHSDMSPVDHVRTTLDAVRKLPRPRG